MPRPASAACTCRVCEEQLWGLSCYCHQIQCMVITEGFKLKHSHSSGLLQVYDNCIHVHVLSHPLPSTLTTLCTTTLSRPSASQTPPSQGSATRPPPLQPCVQSPPSSCAHPPSHSSTSPHSSTPYSPPRPFPASEPATPALQAPTACSHRAHQRPAAPLSTRHPFAQRSCLGPAAPWAGTNSLRRRGPCARSLVTRSRGSARVLRESSRAGWPLLGPVVVSMRGGWVRASETGKHLCGFLA